MTDEAVSPDPDNAEEFVSDSESATSDDRNAYEAAEPAVDEEWPTEDLEAAYRRALEANDAVEWEFDHFAVPSLDDHPDSSEAAAGGAASTETVGDSASGSEFGEYLPDRVTARQVIEAALFVGGKPLTSRKLGYLLRGEYELDAIEDTIDLLNRQYLDEQRPYEIRLGEGGFRLVLREDFERVRNRVYGVGPREELGKEKPGGMLRQLLRRQLIAIQRDPDDRKHVKYVTTPRFLSLFGLGSLHDLPQADELSFK